jgi:hypothetical protein
MKHRQNPELLSMKAVHGSVLVALFLAMVVMAPVSVHAFTFTMDVTGRGGGGIGSYGWLMEENLTHNNPSGTVPDVHPNAPGLRFRPGWADVIDLTVGASWSVAGNGNQDVAAGLIYGPYAIDAALRGDGGYLFSVRDNIWDWHGELIRNQHLAADVAHPSRPFPGLVSFSGWAPNSGNDVVYEKTVNPAPERSTMFLLGCGLVGLAGLGRKRLFRAPAAHRSPLPSIATGSRETQG